MFLHVKLEITGIESLLALLTSINRKVDKIMASQQEEADKLNALATQLGKASDEILKAIQDLKDALAAAGSTSPEVDAATQALTEKAQALDDIVPDVPAP